MAAKIKLIGRRALVLVTAAAIAVSVGAANADAGTKNGGKGNDSPCYGFWDGP